MNRGENVCRGSAWRPLWATAQTLALTLEAVKPLVLCRFPWMYILRLGSGWFMREVIPGNIRRGVEK